MEEIVNYKLSEFLQIKDPKLIEEYLVVLDLLSPLKVINNPNYHWYKKVPKMLHLKAIKELSFGDVTTIRNYFNDASIQGIIESIKMVIDVEDKHIINLTILEFYGIISSMQSELRELNNMEINELSDDSFDINVEAVNAKGRMGKFGVLNVIDSLAKEDILRWEEIEKLPYLTVFTKLMMDNEKQKISNEISELQRKKQIK
ncbi:hypothetical protein ACNQGL_07705 [Flavobacterium sp. LB3P21]|uniref:hypothetical protein n=1 Tax=Flavobacterium sp. LB3P21 TaxID=3401719 RepID=UPI003AACA697